MGSLDLCRSAYSRLKGLNAFILERYRECEAEVLLSQERRRKGTACKCDAQPRSSFGFAITIFPAIYYYFSSLAP